MAWYFRSISLVVCAGVLKPRSRDSFQVVCGLYFPGRMGMRSFTGLPNKHMAGEIFVMGSGVLRYCRIAAWNASTLMAPSDIASDQPFDRLDSYLSSAVAVWECYGAQAVVHSPLT